MDRCKREIEKLYEIACTCQKEYYTSKTCDKESYFIKREESSYIREYGFQTLPDLKAELEKMWSMDETMQKCMQPVLIAAIKLKPADGVVNDDCHPQKRNDEKLSPFIYNF